jgi:formamidopyrimidine-DNA glycosylase
MLEIPEALVIARQTSQILAGCTIVQVIVGQTPHKFAFYAGDPAAYPALLVGKKISHAKARGGMVSIAAGDSTLVFSDGAALRHWPAASKRPDKHQLLLEMDDGSAFTASIQLYRAGIHPRQVVRLLDLAAKDRLFHAIKDTLAEMAAMGGRDTEKDLFGQPGGYQTQLSKNTVGQTGRKCGQTILKEAYLGGSVYVCPGCQRLSK